MTVVINSGPLIALAKLNLLYLLKLLFNKIYITKSVYDEVVINGLRKGMTDAYSIKMFIEKEKNIIEIEKIKGSHKFEKIELDLGEIETIGLAKVKKATFVLIDEENARKEARRNGLKVKGTLGILLMAYQKKTITLEETIYFIEQIKIRHDIWISSELCNKILSMLH